ncbi:MAG: sugar ABC transporter substrate-binding protein [Actinomycetota bacterium]|nr:sugar ABC transporter substrate-binding protein [Actinomycetota bacterium]
MTTRDMRGSGSTLLRRRATAIALTLGSALILAACSSSGTTSSDASSSEAAPASSEAPASSAAPADSPSAAEEAKTIGVVLNNAADSNQADILRGYEDAGKEYGWTVLSVDTQGDPAKANAAISTFVQQGVDGIAAMVYQGNVLQSGIDAAKAAGIPVILNGANELVDGAAAAIPVAAGTEQGQITVDGIEGNGSVLMFHYPPGAPCIAEFEQSTAVFDANPGVTYESHDVPAPGWEVEGQKATATWLQTHPAGEGNLAIWGCWDGPLFGAIAALNAANRDDVLVYGNGGEPLALTAVRDGTMTATILYDQYTGGGIAGAKLLNDAIAAGPSWTPVVQPNPSQLVDASNIEAICTEFPDRCK